MILTRQKRWMAFLLVLTMLAGMISPQAFAEQEPVRETQDGGTVLKDNSSVTQTNYFEVKFEMPEDMAWAAELQSGLEQNGMSGELLDLVPEGSGTAEALAEAEEEGVNLTIVDLPETMMVAEGTLIQSLPEPKLYGYVFLGWYFDKELQHPASTRDVIDKNITLYPRFGSAVEEGEGTANYISALEVPEDFEMLLAANNLTEDELREKVILRDFGKLEPEIGFILTPQAPDLARLVPEEEQRLAAESILKGFLEPEAAGGAGEAPEAENAEEGNAEAAGSREAAPEEDEALWTEPDAPEQETTEGAGTSDEAAPADSAEPVLAAALLEAGLDEYQVRKLVYYYAPEELAQLDALILRDILVQLGYTGDEKPEEILQIFHGEYTSLEELLQAAIAPDEPVPDIWRIMPDTGEWSAGRSHQAEILDTENVRFWQDGEAQPEKIIFYNITIHKENYNHMELAPHVVDIPSDEVEGIDLGGGLLKISQDTNGDLEAVKNERSGEMTYLGTELLDVGTIAYVHEPGLEFRDTFGMTGSAPVTYVKITEDLGGGRYAYIMPEMEEVVFTPDNIPVPDAGDFGSGSMVVPVEQLDFSDLRYSGIGLDADTVVQPGDLITAYIPDPARPEAGTVTGYGQITEIHPVEGGMELSYTVMDRAEMMDAAGFYQHMDNIALPLTEEDLQALEASTREELEAKGAFQDVQNYITALIMAEDYELKNTEYEDALKHMKFQTDTGEEISLEEIRRLAGTLEWDSKPTTTSQISFMLKHFDGTGLRLMFSYGTGCSYKFEAAGEKSQIRMDIKVQFELEIALGASLDCSTKWGDGGSIGLPFDYPEGWEIVCALNAGLYTGVGVNATVQTQAQKTDKKKFGDVVDEFLGDSEERKSGSSTSQSIWGERIKDLGGFIENVDEIKNVVTEGSVKENGEQQKKGERDSGDSIGGSASDKYYAKYKAFLDNSAEYIPIYKKALLEPVALVTIGVAEMTLGINFILAWKLNVMIGATMEFGVARQTSITIEIPSFDSSTNTMDLETPHFNFDFYIFGQIGLKASVEFDLRVGVISTKLDSVGAILEIGVQIEFYGFFIFSAGWTYGKGWNYETLGTLLVEVSLFAELGVKAQLGDDALKAEAKVVGFSWPIMTLGTERVFVDMNPIEEDEEKALNYDITGEKYQELNKEVLKVLAMEVDSGETEDHDMDAPFSVKGSHVAFRSMGQEVLQKDEQFFEVEIMDTDEDGHSLYSSSFLYDPETNRIYPKPHTAEDDELWAEMKFTFHNDNVKRIRSAFDENDKVAGWMNYGMGFGLQKEGISRTVKLHWKGTPSDIIIETYEQKDPYEKIANISELAAASEEDLLRMYEKTGEQPIGKTFDLMILPVPADYKVFDASPNYERAFLAIPYDPDVQAFYDGIQTKLAAYKQANSARSQVLKDTEGYLWALPGDASYAVLGTGEETRVRVFYNRKMQDSHWLLLDTADGEQVGKGTVDRSMPEGLPVMDYLTDSLHELTADKAYSYETWIVPASSVSSAVRSRLRDGYGIRQYRQVLPDRSTWEPLTETTIVPEEGFYIFVERTPYTRKVTWMFDSGSEETLVKPGDPIVPPGTARRSGYELDYWADEDGEIYETMPDDDLVLYPVFIGKEHTITWILNGEQITTVIRTGDVILPVCPFPGAGKDEELFWRIGAASAGERITESSTMPDQNLMLYGTLYRYKTVTWKNGKKTLTTTKEPVGEKLKLYEPKLEEGMVCRWLKDGALLPKSYKMPDEDITLQALIYAADHEHDWQVTGPYKEPTCTDGSKRHVKCSICFTEKTEKLDPDPDAHDWKSPVYTWSKDNKTVKARRVCARDSSHVETETVNTSEEVLKKADCVTAGESTFTASFKNPAFTMQIKTAAVPANEDHEAGEAVRENVVEATCLKEGSYDEVTYCSRCKKEISRHTVTIPLAGHTPAAAVVENATPNMCTAGGTYEEVVYCSVCGAELTRETKKREAPGHTPSAAVRENVIEPTCTAEGSYEEVIRCSVCGEELSRETKALPAAGHTAAAAPVKENEVPSTCIAEGSYDEVTYCSVCREELSRVPKAIPLGDHTEGEPVEENRVEPSCDKAGSYEEVIYCRVCGKELNREEKTLGRIPHTPGDPVRENVEEAGCTEDGSCEEVVYCRVCGEELSREEKPIAAKGHVEGEVKIENEKAATCKAEGEHDEVTYCTVCGEELSRTTVIDPKIDHTPGEPKQEDVHDPTCVDDGDYYLVTYCEVCGTKLEEEQVILPALGHDWSEDSGDFPATSEGAHWTAGHWLWDCKRCDYYDEGINQIPVSVSADFSGAAYDPDDKILTIVFETPLDFLSGNILYLSDLLTSGYFFAWSGYKHPSEGVEYIDGRDFRIDDDNDNVYLGDCSNETLEVAVTYYPPSNDYETVEFTLVMTFP